MAPRDPAGPILVLGPVEPPVGGVSRYCRALADLLGSHTAQLDLMKTSSRQLGIERSPWRRLVKRLVGGRRYALRSELARCEFRLVVENHPFVWSDPLYAARVREIVRCPYVLVIHDGAFPQVVRDSRARGATLAADLRWISGAICMSDEIRDALSDLLPSVRSVRLTPLLRTSPPDEDIGATAPLADFFRRYPSVVTTSGALAEHYGLRDVFEAYGLLRSEGRRIGLVLLLGSFAREPQSTAALRSAVDRWGDESVLALTDFPGGDAVIARSSVYVRPSRVDSFGLGLHEAMLSGVPVVAARHPTRPPGVLEYEPGDAAALAAALTSALSSQTRATAAARVPALRAAVERNREQTRDFLARAGDDSSRARP